MPRRVLEVSNIPGWDITATWEDFPNPFTIHLPLSLDTLYIDPIFAKNLRKALGEYLHDYRNSKTKKVPPPHRKATRPSKKRAAA